MFSQFKPTVTMEEERKHEEQVLTTRQKTKGLGPGIRNKHDSIIENGAGAPHPPPTMRLVAAIPDDRTHRKWHGQGGVIRREELCIHVSGETVCSPGGAGLFQETITRYYKAEADLSSTNLDIKDIQTRTQEKPWYFNNFKFKERQRQSRQMDGQLDRSKPKNSSRFHLQEL